MLIKHDSLLSKDLHYAQYNELVRPSVGIPSTLVYSTIYIQSWPKILELCISISEFLTPL